MLSMVLAVLILVRVAESEPDARKESAQTGMIVAPIFEHDEYFSFGYRYQMPVPTALEIIQQVMAQNGISTFVKDKIFPGRTITIPDFPPTYDEKSTPTLWVRKIIMGRFDYEEVSRRYRNDSPRLKKATSSDFYVDLFNEEHSIGIVYTERLAAFPLREQVQKIPEDMVIGIFYDPTATIHSPKGPGLQPRGRSNLEMRQVHYEATVRMVAARRNARNQARRLLEMQVVDFVEWLKTMEIILNSPASSEIKCSVGDREYNFLPYRSYDTSGAILVEGGYCGPERHGPWNERHKDGSLIKRGVYNAGVEEGYWQYRSLNEGGYRIKSGSYLHGKKEGQWTVITETGNIRETASFKNDEPVGEYFNRDIGTRATFPDGHWESTDFLNLESGELRKGRPHGAWTFGDDLALLRARYKNGRPAGRWTWTGKDGCVRYEGRYVRGLKEGLWTYLDQPDAPGEGGPCVLYKTGKYRHGKKSGIWREYDRSGRVVIEATYDDGTTDKAEGDAPNNAGGLAEKKRRVASDARSLPAERWNCEGGFLKGIQKAGQVYWVDVKDELVCDLTDTAMTPEEERRIFPNAAPEEGVATDQRLAHCRRYRLPERRLLEEGDYWISASCETESHSTWNLMPRFPAGPVRQWYPDGKPKEVLDFPVGRFESYHPNGVKAVEGKLDHMRPEGHWRYWHENGHLSEKGDFAAGKKQGHWKRWYASGNPADEGAFESGVYSGPWVFWYANGQKTAEGSFDEGMMIGTWSFWLEDRGRSWDVEFVDGRHRDLICRDENGNVVDCKDSEGPWWDSDFFDFYDRIPEQYPRETEKP